MPTVLRLDGYRFYFFSNEGDEPPHVHVEQGGRNAKFWLAPVVMESASGFRRSELRYLERIIREREPLLLRRWYEWFPP